MKIKKIQVFFPILNSHKTSNQR